MASFSRHLVEGSSNQQNQVKLCEVCQCKVGGSWDTHVQGIRHRRNSLNQQQPNNKGGTVVSVFETLPSGSSTVYRSKDPLLQHLTPARPAQEDPEVTTVQTKALRKLICDAGVGTPLYRNASARFHTSLIKRAKELYPAQVSTAVQSGGLELSLGSSAAQLAYLAHQLPLSTRIHTIHISIPFKTYGPESVAMAAALRLLADSLRRDNQLLELTIHIDPQDYVIALLQGGTGFTKLKDLWGNILVALRSVFESNSTLCAVHIHSPPDVLPVDELAELQTAMALLPRRLRVAVLMGQHQRLGSQSHISRLPAQLVEEVLQLAVPKAPCKLHLTTATIQLPADDSSSEDTSSDSDDASGGDDSDSSNDGSDDGSESGA